MTPKPVIWFFKDARSSEAYTLAFEETGFTIRYVPVLRFEFETEWDPIPAVDAIVLTSQRAAEALLATQDLERLLPPFWSDLPWYTLGPSTSESLKTLGVYVGGSTARTSTELARIILEMKHERVAFLAGDPHRPELPMLLQNSGVNVRTRIVYRTFPNLREPLSELEKPDIVTFFSPRGVEIVAAADGPNWKEIAVAAIGPTTGAAVRRLGWNLIAVSNQADARSVLQAVQNALDIIEPEPSIQ